MLAYGIYKSQRRAEDSSKRLRLQLFKSSLRIKKTEKWSKSVLTNLFYSSILLENNADLQREIEGNKANFGR